MRYAICFLALVVSGANSARGESDTGAAGFYPWSGYWWQHKSGGLTGPLSKYDRIFGSQAAAWERSVHCSPDVPDWHGHCHAWSAAAVSEQEPRQQRSLHEIGFGIGDQKGLLSACHAADVANVYGDRFGDGAGNEDRADLQPDELWRLLQMYVKQRKLPLICDLEPGDQVWNYPICAYRVEYSEAGDGWHEALLQLVAVTDNVQPDFVGHRDELHKYTFRVRMQGGAIVAGSAEWTGSSVNDHPDFAWYPYVGVAENPEIDIVKVSEIVGRAVGGENPPGENGELPENPPTEEPSSVDPPTEIPLVADPTELPPVDGETSPEQPVVAVDFDELLSAGELVSLVTDRTSQFVIDAFVDLGDGGRYAEGQPVRVSLRSAQAGYLYVFDIDPAGDLHLVFPLPGQTNQIVGDQLYDFPAEKQRPWFFAHGAGQHDLKAIVTSQPLQLTGFYLPAVPEKTKPQQTGQAGVQQQQTKWNKPQPMRIYPAARQQVQAKLVSSFRKGVQQDQQSTGKAGGFAQDQCSYFVLPATAPKQKPKPVKP